MGEQRRGPEPPAKFLGEHAPMLEAPRTGPGRAVHIRGNNR